MILSPSSMPSVSTAVSDRVGVSRTIEPGLVPSAAFCGCNPSLKSEVDGSSQVRWMPINRPSLVSTQAINTTVLKICTAHAMLCDRGVAWAAR